MAEEQAKERKTEVINRYGGRNLSKMLKISHPAVSKWKVIPPLRAYQIAEFGDFDAGYIRPDLPKGYNNKAFIASEITRQLNTVINETTELEASLTISSHSNDHYRPDIIDSRFLEALNGTTLGQSNGNLVYWNIFDSSQNSQELIDYVRGAEVSSKDASLNNLGLIFRSENDGYEIAYGFQYNNEKLKITYDDISTAEFDGDGKISMFLGGYSDFLNHQSDKIYTNKSSKKKESLTKIKKIEKLSFKFKFELENIPQAIKIIQEEISSLKNELKDSNLYISNNNRFEEVTEKLSTLEKELENKENRWLELLEMEEVIKKENE